ncbi:amino acid adenylation domain-containing protein [Streptomyces capoamus]|uniref:amino acid adenylation domain-containing protein n=1 Tax=Streptomyces capoamus TaxID=68183 RepID=UPI003392B66F
MPAHDSLEAVLPLAPLQEGLFFHAQSALGGTDEYVSQAALRLDGPLDTTRLLAACRAAVQRHAALRASFLQRKNGRTVQLVHREVTVPCTELDLSDEEETGPRLARHLLDERTRGFDLGRPPLIRFSLLRTAAERHVLVLTHHHILLDGWSLSGVLADLLALYAAGDDHLLPRPVPVTGYLSWLAKQDTAASLAAWRTALTGLAEPTLTAPGLAPARTLPDLTVAELAPQRTAALLRAARDRGLTLNTVAQVAWALVLASVTGSTDVVFGQTVSVRSAPVARIQDMVGLLVNSVPVRVRLDPGESLGALLDRVQREQSALAEHHHTGLSDIQRASGHGTLFDTFLSLGDPGAGAAPARSVDGLRIAPLTDEPEQSADQGARGSTHYPLSLVVVPGERLRLELTHRGEVFTERQARELLDRMAAALDAVVTAPHTPVAAVDLPGTAGSAALPDPHTPARGPAPDTTLPALFEEQARRTPGRVALSDRHRALGYREVNTAANRLARALVARGIGPEDTVAVMLSHGTELVVVLLAVLKAGAAYLPIDAALPAERVAFMLEDARPAVIVADGPPDSLPHGAVSPAGLAADQYPGTDLTDADRVRPLGPDNGAYVIYTSGSTGRPKGVQVEHRAMTAYLEFARHAYPGLAGTAVVQSPISFDFTVTGVFGTLTAGGRLHMAALGDPAPDGLGRPSFTKVTPSQLPLLTTTHTWLSPTRDLVIGGEQLTGEALGAWRVENTHATAVNEYGPTEATVGCMEYRIGPADTVAPGAVPVGRPVPGTAVHVLDPWLRPVPAGTPGEVYLAGPNLARGYVRRPGTTAQRFVANPFGAPGERMYLTGDIARWGHDGQLVYLGRNDGQLKVRGQRVEPTEIEAAVCAHPAVRHCAVDTRNGPKTHRLVAYVVLDGDPGPQALREHAAARLPASLVPDAFVPVTEIPLTSNGKLDRAALTAITLTTGDEAAAGRPPRSETERLLCRLFSEVLHTEVRSVDDGFFELGGDSIMSLQLVARARAEGLELSARQIFEHRTVAELAAVCGPLAPGRTPVRHDEGTGRFPAPPIVHRLRELSGPIASFNQSALLAVPARLGLQRLVAAVQALLDRHDALRLQLTDGVELSVPPAGAVEARGCVHRVDISGDRTPEAVIADHAARAAERLDPRAGHLVEVVWYDAGDRPGRLLVMIHHLAVDAVSWRILLPDLHAAWVAAGTGEPALPAPVPTSLRRWCRALSEAAVTPRFTAQLDRWRRILAEAGPQLTDRASDPERDVHGTARTLTVELPPAQAEALLTALPAAVRTSAEDVLLTALAVAAARLGAGDNGLLLDLEGHGRQDLGGLDLSRTVGWLTTLHPVLLAPGTTALDDASLLRALKTVKEQLRDMPDHGIGYGLLRHLNDRGRAVLGALPGPQVAFNYLGRYTADGGSEWRPVAESAAPPTHPGMPLAHPLEINAVAEDHGGGPRLTANWTWAPALLPERQIRRLADEWTTVLHALADLADRGAAHGLTPSDVPLVRVTQDELESLEGDGPVADVLPLSPAQQGLLFHAHYEHGGPDVHTVQTVLDLEGDLDAARLRAACLALVRRHEALRARFTLLPSGEPVQVLADRVDVPWSERDVRGAGTAVVAQTLLEERLRPFDLARAPLLRWLLLRQDTHRHSLVLTHHHILTDGRSTAILLHELAHLYRNGANAARELPDPVPYRRHYAWLQRQDTAAAVTAARAAWRKTLSGAEPTLLAPYDDTARVRALPEQSAMELAEDTTAALRTLARDHGVTLNTVVQVAWALTLHHLTGADDVVFGATASIRTPEVPGHEDLVGLLINTVPVRIRLDARAALGELLRDVHRDQAELAAFRHLSLGDILRETGTGRLFDTCLVFENYAAPRPDGADPHPAALRITGMDGHDPYHYPVKLAVTPEQRLHLSFGHRPDLVPESVAEQLARLFPALLRAMAAASSSAVGELMLDPDALQRTRDDLAAHIAHVLGAERAGPDDDFFDQGADSLTVLRLTARINAAFGRDLDVRTVAERRTARRLAPLCVSGAVVPPTTPTSRSMTKGTR